MKSIVVLLCVVCMNNMFAFASDEDESFISATSNAANLVCSDVNKNYRKYCQSTYHSISALKPEYSNALMELCWDVNLSNTSIADTLLYTLPRRLCAKSIAGSRCGIHVLRQ